MLDLALVLTPTPAYFVVGLSIPVLATALVALALAGAVALTAGSGLLQSGRGLATLIALTVIATVTALLDALLSAARGRTRALPTLIDLGEQATPVPGAGPKAQHLATLAAAGLRVPEGWVFAVAHEKAPRIGALYRTLRASGHGRFIVRSCFAEEDGTGRSFAGLYESRAWDVVEGRQALASVVQAVINSRNSPRAAAYRDGPPARGPVAVLIQRRIPHAHHGFAASADVATGLRERRLVDITSPDSPWSGHLDVTTDQLTGTPPEGVPVREIANLVGRVEQHLGQPVEIEWGLERGELWLYQARPLTALPETRTWIQGRGLELPWHPLTPLAASFLLGEASPAALITAPLKTMGIAPLAEDALTLREGRLFVEASAAHALTRAVADPSPRGWRQLARCAWQAWTMGAPAYPPPPDDPPTLSPTAHLEALEALREQALEPLVEAQVHAMLLASLCTHALGTDAPAPAPQTAIKQALEAMARGTTGPIAAARRWLWWRAIADLRAENTMEAATVESPASLLAARGLDDPTRLADELVAIERESSGEATASRGLLATLRDRALTHREVSSARIQATNVEARHHARQIDAHLAERVAGWHPGDVAHVSLRELRILVVDPLHVPEVIADLPARRARWQAQLNAHIPAVWRVDAEGATIEAAPPSADATLRGSGLGQGTATGELLRASEATSPDQARGRVLFLEAPAASLTPICLVASAVLLAKSGPLSHLAMVIRERGIPCVLVTHLPETLEDGVRVRVDAVRGEVSRAD